MKNLDPVKERAERKLTLTDFVTSYNENLPESFPRASQVFLREFQKAYPGLFKDDKEWSLDQHRKKFMDWLPQHIKHISSCH